MSRGAASEAPRRGRVESGRSEHDDREDHPHDGRLYFGDFGLAVSPDFGLTEEERVFVARHRSYDPCRAAVGFVHAVSAYFLGGRGDWKEDLLDYVRTGRPRLPLAVAAVVERYGTRAIAFLEWSRTLREGSKTSPYPAALLERMIAEE